MSDPRNVAHDKKVKQEKEHHQSPSAAGGKPKRVKKPATKTAPENTGDAAEAVAAPVVAGDVEKSATVLSKLKEMEFHSRANVETLAGLTLTIAEELKQKEFSEPIGALYSAQDSFQTQIKTLIESYEAKCESLKPSA